MLNKIILIGRVATAPELKYTPGGHAVTTFRIAVDRPVKSGGEKETDFIDVVAWRATAEFVCNYMTTGRLISVDGRLQIRNWVAQDNTKRRTAEVIANDIRALDSPKRNNTVSEEQAPLPLEDAPAMATVGAVNAPGGEQFVADPFADD